MLYFTTGTVNPSIPSCGIVTIFTLTFPEIFLPPLPADGFYIILVATAKKGEPI
jgi:hypothetical protein